MTQVIGKPRRRVDARAKVMGQTRFADDLAFPRMLYCKLLRSRHPHARLLNVDVTRALAVPGVHAVLTGADFDVRYGILPVSQDEEPLRREEVRFVGDPIAAVVATSEELAADAVALISVDYEELPPTNDVHKAIAFEFGDVDEALAGADRVFDDVFFYQGSTHLALEQHASVALLDGDGRLTLYSSTQIPHYLHRTLAKTLQLPAHRIRVVATPNGGGFGGKTDPFNHEIVVAKAALVTGRPVKICLTREEVFYCHRGRHPVTMRMRTGVKRDGSIVALDLQTLLDGGAYGSYGVASTFYTGALQTVTYDVPRYRFRGCRMFTNKPPCGPKRGHGTPQPRFAQEVQLDKIAVALGRDPADLRLQQLVSAHSLTANWMRVETIALRQCIDKVVTESRWRERWQKLPFGRGIGIACSAYLCGAGLPIYWNDLPHSGVQLAFDRSGLVTLFCGATEVGQGSDDVLAGIVAEVLGLDPSQIKLVTGDTDLTPVDLGSYSSRVTFMAGNAALQAATRAKIVVGGAVSKKLGIPLDRIVFAEGRVFDAQEPEQGVTFADAVALAEAAVGTIVTAGSYKPPEPSAKYKGGGVGPSPSYSYTAAVAEVDVDGESGWVSVRRVWIAHDIGRALNPVLARGQLIGGVYMAAGEALMEEQAFRGSLHRGPSMLDYKSPTTMEMPEVDAFLIEEPEASGPFGAKEIGQGPLLPVVPAIANAVFDAVGVRVDEVPITPEKVLRALLTAERRSGPPAFPPIAWPEVQKIAPPSVEERRPRLSGQAGAPALHGAVVHAPVLHEVDE